MVEAGSPQLNFGYISACLVPLCRNMLIPWPHRLHIKHRPPAGHAG